MDEVRDIAVDPVETEAGQRWPAGPWPRLWARLFDTWLFALLLGGAIGIVWGDVFTLPLLAGPGGKQIFGLLLLPFVLLTDAAVVALCGSTPGKWLAGLRIERDQGGSIGRGAFRRNADLYVTGFFLGLPILNLFGFAHARIAVVDDDCTGWDERTDSWVIDRGSATWRTVLVAFLALALQFGSLAADQYARFQQPKWDRESIVAALPEMNRGLPTFIDEVTRLDRISFTMAEGVMIYDYQLIHRDASAVTADEVNDPAAMRASLADSYCAAGMRFFRDRDIPMRHRIRRGEKLHADFLLRASDCGG